MSMNDSSKERFIVVTRPEEKFRIPDVKSCFEVINCPLSALERTLLDKSTIEEIRDFRPDVIVLTSEFGARIFLQDYLEYLEGRELKFVAIGKATSEVLEKIHYDVMLPDTFDSPGIVKLISEKIDKKNRIALFRSGNANRVIDNFLSEQGYEFRNFETYRIRKIIDNRLPDLLLSGRCFGVVLTSPMEAEIFAEQCKELSKERISGLRVFAIGNTTSRKLRDLGIPESEPRGNSDFKQLIQAITKKYC